jgi:hypothetical protein
MVDPSTSPFVPSSSSYQSLYAQVSYAKAKSHLSHISLNILAHLSLCLAKKIPILFLS